MTRIYRTGKRKLFDRGNKYFPITHIEPEKVPAKARLQIWKCLCTRENTCTTQEQQSTKKKSKGVRQKMLISTHSKSCQGSRYQHYIHILLSRCLICLHKLNQCVYHLFAMTFSLSNYLLGTILAGYFKWMSTLYLWWLNLDNGCIGQEEVNFKHNLLGWKQNRVSQIRYLSKPLNKKLWLKYKRLEDPSCKQQKTLWTQYTASLSCTAMDTCLYS